MCMVDYVCSLSHWFNAIDWRLCDQLQIESLSYTKGCSFATMEMPAQSSIYSSENLNDKTVSICRAKFSVNARTVQKGWVLPLIPVNFGRSPKYQFAWTVDNYQNRFWQGCLNHRQAMNWSKIGYFSDYINVIHYEHNPIIRLQHICIYTIILLNKCIYVYIYIYTTNSWCIFHDVKQKFESRWRIGKGSALHLSSTEWVGGVVGKASLGDCPWLFVSRHWLFLEDWGHWKLLKQFFNFECFKRP